MTFKKFLFLLIDLRFNGSLLWTDFFSMFPCWSSVLCQIFVLIDFLIHSILHSSALVTPRPTWSRAHCFSYISYIPAESTRAFSLYAGGIEGNVERVTVVRVGWRRQSTYLPRTDPRGTLEFQKIISSHRCPEIAHSDTPGVGQQLGGGHYFTMWLVLRIYILGGYEDNSTGYEDSRHVE